jgi:hypothetical protein
MNLESREVEEQYVLRVKDPALAEQLRCTAARRRLQPAAALCCPALPAFTTCPPNSTHTTPLQGDATAAAGADGSRHQQRPAAVPGQ